MTVTEWRRGRWRSQSRDKRG